MNDFDEEDGAKEISIDRLIKNWEALRDAHLERAGVYDNGLTVFMEKIHDPYLLVKAYYNPKDKKCFYTAVPVQGESLRKAIDDYFRIRRKE